MYPPFDAKDLWFIKLVWGEGYVPYPRVGQSPSLRMRLGRVPWMKFAVSLLLMWTFRRRVEEGVMGLLGSSGVWGEKVRPGWL